MSEQVDQIVNSAEAIFSTWQVTLDQVARTVGPNGEGFDLAKPVPSLGPGPLSFEQLSTKVAAAAARLRQVSALDLTAMPDNVVGDIDNHAKALRTAIDNFKSQIDAFLADAEVTSVDPIGLLLAMTQVTPSSPTAVSIVDLTSARNAVRKALSDASRIRRVVDASLAKISPRDAMKRLVICFLMTLVLTGCDDNSLLPLSEYEKVNVNVYFYFPNQQEVYLGSTKGARSCGAIAYSYASSKNLSRSAGWSYVCCTIRKGSQCYEKIR